MMSGSTQQTTIALGGETHAQTHSPARVIEHSASMPILNNASHTQPQQIRYRTSNNVHRTSPAHHVPACKRKQRSEQARSVLSSMTWRFLTEAAVSDCPSPRQSAHDSSQPYQYQPPTMLTKEGMEYMKRMDEANTYEAQSLSPTTVPSSSLSKCASLAALFTDVATPEQSALHPLYRGQSRAPSGNESHARSRFSRFNPNKKKEHGTDETIVEEHGQQASRSSASGSNTPPRQWYANTPLTKIEKYHRENAKHILLQTLHPVNPNVIPPSVRHALPPLPPPVHANQLNITTETNTRIDGLMEKQIDAALEKERREHERSHPNSAGQHRPSGNGGTGGINSAYDDLVADIEAIATASIEQSQMQALPAAHPTIDRLEEERARIRSKKLARKKRQEERAKRQQEGGPSQTDEKQAPASNRREKDQNELVAARPVNPSDESASDIDSASDSDADHDEDDLMSSDGEYENPDPEVRHERLERMIKQYHDRIMREGREMSQRNDPHADRPNQRAMPGSYFSHSTASSSSGTNGGDGADGGERVILWRESGEGLKEATDLPPHLAKLLLNQPTADERLRRSREVKSIRIVEGDEEGAEAYSQSYSHRDEAEDEDDDDDEHANPFERARTARTRRNSVESSRSTLHEQNEEDEPTDPPSSSRLSTHTLSNNVSRNPSEPISPSSYADRSSQYESDRHRLAETMEELTNKSVRFEYEHEQKRKAKEGEDAAAAQGQAEGEGETEEKAQTKPKPEAFRPEFRFRSSPPTDAGSHARNADAIMAQLKALELKELRRKAKKKKAEAAARRLAMMPSRFQVNGASKPHPYDPATQSSFIAHQPIRRTKRTLGAWYIPRRKWRVKEIKARSNDDDDDDLDGADEEDEDGRLISRHRFPRHLQEKQQALSDTIPTLFISAMYKAHLDKVSQEQKQQQQQSRFHRPGGRRSLSIDIHSASAPSLTLPTTFTPTTIPAADSMLHSPVRVPTYLRSLPHVDGSASTSELPIADMPAPAISHSSTTPGGGRHRGRTRSGSPSKRVDAHSPAHRVTLSPVRGNTPSAATAETRPTRLPSASRKHGHHEPTSPLTPLQHLSISPVTLEQQHDAPPIMVPQDDGEERAFAAAHERQRKSVTLSNILARISSRHADSAGAGSGSAQRPSSSNSSSRSHAMSGRAGSPQLSSHSHSHSPHLSPGHAMRSSMGSRGSSREKHHSSRHSPHVRLHSADQQLHAPSTTHGPIMLPNINTTGISHKDRHAANGSMRAYIMQQSASRATSDDPLDRSGRRTPLSPGLEVESDDDEYAHPLEVGLKREAKLIATRYVMPLTREEEFTPTDRTEREEEEEADGEMDAMPAQTQQEISVPIGSGDNIE